MTKTAVIQIRVQQDLKDLWMALAKDEGISLSEWIVKRCTGPFKPVEVFDSVVITPMTLKPVKIKAKKEMAVKLETVAPRKHHPQCGCLMCKPK